MRSTNKQTKKPKPQMRLSVLPTVGLSGGWNKGVFPWNTTEINVGNTNSKQRVLTLLQGEWVRRHLLWEEMGSQQLGRVGDQNQKAPKRTQDRLDGRLLLGPKGWARRSQAVEMRVSHPRTMKLPEGKMAEIRYNWQLKNKTPFRSANH